MRHLLLTILLIFSIHHSYGQVNTDSLFNSAIEKSKSKDYSGAIQEASHVLELLPTRQDVTIFIANVHAWNHDYPQALDYINKAYEQDSTAKELYDSWLNVLLWSEEYNKLLSTANKAEQVDYPDTFNLVLKKTLALKALKEYEDGITLIEDHAALRDSTAIEKLYHELQLLTRKQSVSLYYTVDIFDQDNREPQHLAYIEYAYKKNANTFVPRFSYAYRFEKRDYQLELDYYRTLNNGHYIYSNYGKGFNNGLFSQHRAGLEYYFPAGNAFEFSVGGRYLNTNADNVLMLTGHMSKYISSWWLSFRPFYVFNDLQNSLTLIAHSRLYGKTTQHYWAAELAYGNSPDERYTISQTPMIFTLKSYRCKIEKNLPIFKYSEIKFSAAYNYEEYIPDNYRNRFVFETLLRYRF